MLEQVRINPTTAVNDGLAAMDSAPLKRPLSAAEVLRRPELNLTQVASLHESIGHLPGLPAEVVMADIADWIGADTAPLPSGADRRAEAALLEEEDGERAVAVDGSEPAEAEAGS